MPIKIQDHNPDFVEMIVKAIRSNSYLKQHKGKEFLQIPRGNVEKCAVQAAREIEKYMRG
jgi:hypothetical protein